MQMNAQSLIFIGNRLLDHGVEMAQEGFVTYEKVSLRAKGVKHARKLNGDIACTNNGNFFGLLVNVEEAIAVDAKLGTGNLRRRAWAATDSNENLLGMDHNLGAVIEGDLDLVPGQQPTPTMQVFDLVVAKIALVNPIQTLDVGVSLGLERGPVERGSFLDGKAIGLGLVKSLGYGSGIIRDLFGDAPMAP